MPRVGHFEIHATDPDTLVAFYSEVFGWQITKWEGPLDYWVVTTGPDSEPGINGAIVRRGVDRPPVGATPSAYVCTVMVDDLDRTLAQALARGGIEALPKMAVPGVGWVAYAIDPDGNVFGMMQDDPSAA